MNMLQAMEVFVGVVDAGGFARAAERLQLRRPAVTKAIQQLELELGVQLRRRSTRKLSVTTEGADFYARCNKPLGDVADTLAYFSPTRPPKGPVRVDLPISLVNPIIIPALPQFQALHPDIDLTIRTSDHLVDLVKEGVDCALRLGEIEDSGLIVRRMGAVPMLTCAAPSYLTKHGKPKKIEDLDAHVAVNFLIGHSRRTMDWVFREDGRDIPISMRSGVVVDDSEALVGCAVAGLGLAQAPQPTLLPHVQTGALVEILKDAPVPPKPISLMLTDRRFANPAVQAFADWVRDLVKSHPLNRPFPRGK
jgi:LysR family transcriptional regulator, regulator for bpeEF and oprC